MSFESPATHTDIGGIISISQEQLSEANRTAWSHRAYEAATRGYGSPAEAAKEIKANPESVLRETLRHFSALEGRAVANLLGSHGRRAVALSLLGAEVTVVDISEENERFAHELADAAGVSLTYVVSDLLQWVPTPRAQFDYVFMEYGVLHYFVDLAPLTRLVWEVLKPDGHLILHEFHPFTRKCQPVDRDGRLYIDGDYFSDGIEERKAPFSGVFSSEETTDFPTCRYRFWNLGEIVSAVCAGGLAITTLTENPHPEHPILPGTFTLVASRGP